MIKSLKKPSQESLKDYLTVSQATCIHCGVKLRPAWAHDCFATRLTALNARRAKYRKLSTNLEGMLQSSRKQLHNLKDRVKHLKTTQKELIEAQNTIQAHINWLEARGISDHKEFRQPRLLESSYDFTEEHQRERKKAKKEQNFPQAQIKKAHKRANKSFQFTKQEEEEGEVLKSEDFGFQQILKTLKPAPDDLTTSYTNKERKVKQYSDLFYD